MQNIVKDFIPQGGKHCITNSLKQIFSYYGYPLSEEMMFGLASGLSFLYLNQSSSPMLAILPPITYYAWKTQTSNLREKFLKK